MLPLFYLPTLTGADSIEVTGDVAHHAITVTRLTNGDEIFLSDGCGAWIRGVITEAAKKSFKCEVIERGSEPQPSPILTVVQALPKSDRVKEAIELLVEAGVDRIIPWQSARSIAKWQEDSREKWQQGAITASQQSRRFTIPKVEEALKGSDIAALSGKTIVLHESAATPISSLVDKSWTQYPEIFIVIGPEGGISDEELELLAKTTSVVKLGTPVLRSAHAGIAALASVNSLLGRW